MKSQKFKFATSCTLDQRLVDLLWRTSTSQGFDTRTSSLSIRGEAQWWLLSRHAPVTAAVACNVRLFR